ncbi:MAG: hypothetical protein HW400_973 [Candidatus Levybacteria bacterium]|nr:hypothetical protein [Candidatus Levybacteria bacterium]
MVFSFEVRSNGSIVLTTTSVEKENFSSVEQLLSAKEKEIKRERRKVGLFLLGNLALAAGIVGIIIGVARGEVYPPLVIAGESILSIALVKMVGGQFKAANKAMIVEGQLFAAKDVKKDLIKNSASLGGNFPNY